MTPDDSFARDSLPIEAVYKVSRHPLAAWRGQAAPVCELADEPLWRDPLLAERRDSRVAVPLGESQSVGADHQRNVAESGRYKFECGVEQELARGRSEQVVAANDFSNAHRGIVHDNGQLVGRRSVAFANDEVADLFRDVDGQGSVVQVLACDGT